MITNIFAEKLLVNKSCDYLWLHRPTDYSSTQFARVGLQASAVASLYHRTAERKLFIAEHLRGAANIGVARTAIEAAAADYAHHAVVKIYVDVAERMEIGVSTLARQLKKLSHSDQ